MATADIRWKEQMRSRASTQKNYVPFVRHVYADGTPDWWRSHPALYVRWSPQLGIWRLMKDVGEQGPLCLGEANAPEPLQRMAEAISTLEE